MTSNLAQNTPRNSPNPEPETRGIVFSFPRNENCRGNGIPNHEADVKSTFSDSLTNQLLFAKSSVFTILHALEINSCHLNCSYNRINKDQRICLKQILSVRVIKDSTRQKLPTTIPSIIIIKPSRV